MEKNVPAAPVNNQYPGAERILGVYPQRQEGLFLQRFKILGGRINWLQWRKVTELSRRYSQRKTIHITTRQDIELHDIAGPDLPAVQRESADVGLTTHSACGDCVRNITICSGCTYDPGSRGAFSAAKLVYEHLADYPCDLPRKFKISFSGCKLLCAKPWISDLGFVTQRDGRFTVIGAGSLGPKPGAGILLYTDLVPQDVLPLCLAALKFFKDCGDRENRSKARLRHLREKLGDEEFKAQLAERFNRLRSSQQWPEVPLDAPRRNLKLLWRLQLPNGNIGLDEAMQLADAAEQKETELRINLEHGLELFGPKIFSLPENLASLENLPVIIACPGLSSCSRAITDTWSVADAIRKHLPNLNKTQLRINISGCPNSCAHSSAANIGLIGMRRKRNEQLVDCFRLFTGGHNGIDSQLAKPGDVIFAEDIPAAVEQLLFADR
jgi:sulfite reductase (NADPH) hemoprotein beta-component